MRKNKINTIDPLDEIFNSLIEDLQKKGVQLTSAEEFITQNELTESQEDELSKLHVPTRASVELDTINRVFKKKNRIRTQYNRLYDYKNEECCRRKNKQSLNKQPVRDLIKLRKYLRSFYFFQINYSDTIKT